MSQKKTIEEALRPLSQEELAEVEERLQTEVDEFLFEWENRPRPSTYPMWTPPFGPRF
jgi:hypothetical protein